MDADGKRLDESAFVKRDVGWEMDAEVFGEDIVLCECAVVGRGRGEPHVGAEVVGAGFAERAETTRDAWLEGDAVAGFEDGGGGADGDNGAGGFVAEDHGGFEDEVGDVAVLPVVDLFGC